VSFQYGFFQAKAVKIEYSVRRFSQFDYQNRAIINFNGYESELLVFMESIFFQIAIVDIFMIRSSKLVC